MYDMMLFLMHLILFIASYLKNNRHECNSIALEYRGCMANTITLFFLNFSLALTQSFHMDLEGA